ncbi:hypothetical protein HBH69_234410 [Parastagonospora nodorum]|nr:hypothetical protein HBH42_241830 [Parastagonospora nodorum]KAH5136798.1 hypothetical protein HBH69_234410 [Parastagonospora nodorum]KAH5344059.1 hypothetical protein HBI48_211330 [Parastagonospora nodorum]KAH6288477.1 hypothetical protein HBI39_217920 [Parastagonospora nodorum]
MSNYDFPEPFEDSYSRYMANLARVHAQHPNEVQGNSMAPAQPGRVQCPDSNSPPQAQHAQPGGSGSTDPPRQLQVQQSVSGRFGYAQPSPQAQQGGYSQRYSNSPSPSPDFSPPTPSAPSSRTSRPPRGDRSRPREIIHLQPEFTWDRESLALLCKSKEIGKKGFGLIANSGKFPGKTEKELQDTWAARKMEAKEYYHDVYQKPRQR